MKIAFSKPTRTEDEREQLFAQFHAAGYDGLQLKTNQFKDYIHEPNAFLERWQGIPGLASALIVWTALDGDGVAFLHDTFRFAQTVGAERIVLCHVHPREGLDDEDIRRIARDLSEIGKDALDHGTKLSLHHHYAQPVMHRPDFDTFFDAVEPGTVGLTIDTAHAVKSGITDVGGLIRDMRGVLDNVHLKDYADGEWRVLGEGTIDFAPIFAAFHAIDYAGWLSADEESGSELASGMRDCRAYIAAGLDAARR